LEKAKKSKVGLGHNIALTQGVLMSIYLGRRPRQERRVGGHEVHWEKIPKRTMTLPDAIKEDVPIKKRKTRYDDQWNG